MFLKQFYTCNTQSICSSAFLSLFFITSLICTLILLPNKSNAKVTNTFVHSLRELRIRPDVEIVAPPVEKPKRRVYSQPVAKKITLKTLDKDSLTSSTLNNLATPLPEYKDYLIRRISGEAYSKFYTSMMNAEKASKENNFSEAITEYTNAIASAPFYYIPYMERGKALAKHNRFFLAIQDFTAAIRLDPQKADPYIFRAVTRTKERQYSLALQDYQSALQLLGNNPILFDKQGELFLTLQDYAGARNSYTQAIEAKPSESRYYYQRAIANAGLHNYTGMLSDYLRAVTYTVYTDRLLKMREALVKNIEEKYYAGETGPLSFIATPDAIFLKTLSLPLYNPFQDIRTIPPTSPSYMYLRQLRELQLEFPETTFKIMQVYVERKEYEDALAVLEEYIHKVASTQQGFSPKTMLVFTGYLYQMMGQYENANTAYSVFLHNTRKYRFFYCNYIATLIEHEGVDAAKGIIVTGREKINNATIFYQLLAYFAVREKDYLGAIQAMEAVVSESNYPYYKLQLLALYGLGREYKKAVPIAQNLLRDKYSPFRPDAFMLYGLLALEEKQYFIAAQNFTEAQKLIPIWIAKVYSYIALSKAGKTKEAIDIVTEQLKNVLLSQKEKMELFTLKGDFEYIIGNYVQSLVSYRLAFNTNAPGYKFLHYNIALLEFKRKNYDSALDNINAFIDEYPNNSRGYLLRGQIEFKRKLIHAALEDYKQAILLDPEATYSYLHVADAIYALGMIDVARKYYTNILERNDEENHILTNTMLAIISFQTNDIEEAIYYCNQILRYDPKNYQAYLILGISYQRIFNFKDAYKNYIRVLQLNPKESFAYTMLAETLERQKDYRKAIMELTKAIDINPLSTESYTMRGLIYIYIGEQTAGLIDLEAAKRIFVMNRDKESAEIIDAIMYNLSKQEYIP